jgi:hypothetical protein
MFDEYIKTDFTDRNHLKSRNFEISLFLLHPQYEVFTLLYKQNSVIFRLLEQPKKTKSTLLHVKIFSSAIYIF